MRRVSMRDAEIVDQIFVGAFDLVLDARPGRHRGGLGASDHPRADLLRVLAGLGARQEQALGPLRDDIHRLPAVGDDAVDARSVAQMQPHRIDALKSLDHRGQRARSVPRRQRRVRAVPMKRQLEMLRGERRHRAEFRVGRMRHHGRIDAAQRALVDQNNFSAAAFLSRRAEKNDPPRQLTRDALQTRDRAERGAGNQVMPARMPVGQRVVLSENRDGQDLWRRTRRETQS